MVFMVFLVGLGVKEMLGGEVRITCNNGKFNTLRAEWLKGTNRHGYATTKTSNLSDFRSVLGENIRLGSDF